MKDAVYLVQTDTTAGFLSENPLSLAKAKKRDPKQPFLICVDKLDKLKKLARVPKNFKKRVRRAKKSTIIYPNKRAIRVVLDKNHSRFLKRFDFIYSSSANKNNCSFDIQYAKNHADIIVWSKEGFFEGKASCIYKIGKKKIFRLR